MFNKNVKRTIAVTLCAAVLSPAAAFAKEFKDVKKTGNYSWAYNYIDELSDRGIINGYEDGNFKPEKEVSFEETLQLLMGIISPSRTEIEEAVKNYRDICISHKVNSWAIESVSFALQKKIISENILKKAEEAGFFETGNKKYYPGRSDVAVFFARGLNLAPNGDTSLLKHKDKNKIDSMVQGYLASLIKAGIFTDTGSDGFFRGDRGIKRSEMAAVTKKSYDYVKYNPIKEETKDFAGKIIFASSVNNRNLLVVEKSDKKYSFVVDNDTKITLKDQKSDGKTISFKDLKEGQEITITYVKSASDAEEGIAKKIVLTSLEDHSIGYVYAIANEKISINYTAFPEKTEDQDKLFKNSNRFSTTQKKEFEFAKDAKIYIYDKTARLSDVKNNDIVEFKLDSDGKIKEAYVYPESYKLRGKLEEIRELSQDGYIKLKLSDNKVYTFYLGRDSRNLRDLRVGDYVDIDLNYKLVRGNGNYAQNSYTGYVNRFNASNYGRDGEIEITDSYNKTNRYKVANYAVLYDKSGNRVNLFNNYYLEGKYVRLQFNGDYVTAVYEIDKDTNFRAMAQVTDVTFHSNNSNEKTVELRILQSDNYKLSPGYRYTINSTTDNFTRLEILELNGNFDGREMKGVSITRLGYSNTLKEPAAFSQSNFVDYKYLRDQY